MFTENEVFYLKPASFGFSNRVRDKVALTNIGSQLNGLESIKSADDRDILLKLLAKQSQDYLNEIDLTKAETGGLHDVVFGGQPIGDFYFTDILSGLYDLKPEDCVLDFGCSTGRVIRNLRSAFEFRAFGCDPRKESIDFNKKHFDDVTWFQNNEAPPIQEYSEHRFDMVFAISVWSHFSPEMCLKWFDEFHKLMNPEGKIIFSTHGTRSIYHFNQKLKKMNEDKASERLNVLRDGGYHYMAYPSGSDLDNKHWGMSFISRDWLENKLTDKWKIANHLPGLAMENQDIYILEKR